MLYFERIDISEWTDVVQTSKPKECNTCPCWYFLNESFTFQTNVRNRCHDLLMMSINLSDICISNIKDPDYRCIIRRISKTSHKHTDLVEKKRNIIEHTNFLSRIKLAKKDLMFGDTEIENNKFYHKKAPIFKKDVDILSISIYQDFFW